MNEAYRLNHPVTAYFAKAHPGVLMILSSGFMNAIIDVQKRHLYSHLKLRMRTSVILWKIWFPALKLRQWKLNLKLRRLKFVLKISLCGLKQTSGAEMHPICSMVY